MFGAVDAGQVTQVVTRNLNKVIDVNFYPVPEAKKSNMRHRPVGLGVQGLADAFIMVRRDDHLALTLAPTPALLLIPTLTTA